MTTVTITKEQVQALAGELAGSVLTNDQWTLVITMVTEEVNVSAYPSLTKANLAALWLAAHKAVKMKAAMTAGSGASAGAGTLSSVTVGSVTKAFAKEAPAAGASLNERELSSTAYGREHLRLVRAWVVRAFLA